MAKDANKQKNGNIEGPPVSSLSSNKDTDEQSVSSTGLNKKIKLKPLDEKYVEKSNAKITELRELESKRLVTAGIEKIGKNLATIIAKNSISAGITQSSQKIVEAEKAAINKSAATLFVNDITNAGIGNILKTQNRSVSPSENTVNENTQQTPVNPDDLDDITLNEVENKNVEPELENIAEETQEKIDKENNIEEHEIDNTSLNEEQKTTLSDLFKGIGEQLNSIAEGIGKGFTDLSNKIRGNKGITFTNITTATDSVVNETKNDVAKTSIGADLKNTITAALDTFNTSFQSSIKNMSLSKRENPSNRDKVFGKMLEDFKSLLVSKQQPEKTENTLQRSTPPSQIQTYIPVQVNQVNSRNSDTSDSEKKEIIKADKAAATQRVNNIINSSANTINRLETIKEETEEDLQRQKTDGTVSRQNLSSSISSNPVSGPRLNNGINSFPVEGVDQEKEIQTQADPKLFNPQQNLQSNSTTQTHIGGKGRVSEETLDSYDNLRMQQQQPQNLGLLNTNSVDSLNLGQFHNNRPQQYVPRNPELDDIYRKLDRIEDRLANSQQQPAPEEKKSEMSNGMKAGIAVCFLLLFMINPGLVLVIGAAAAVGVGSFYAGKAIMGKIDEYRDNRKNKENNNKALEQQQQKSKEPEVEINKGVKPPNTPNFNAGQNVEQSR